MMRTNSPPISKGQSMPPLLRRTLVTATVALTVASGAAAVATLAGPASATDNKRGDHGTTRHEIRHDVSPPLASLAPVRPGQGDGENDRIRRMPNRGGTGTDPVVQRTAGPAIAATKANFDGIGQGFTGPAGTFN